MGEEKPHVWLAEREGCVLHPKVFYTEAEARHWASYITVNPPVKITRFVRGNPPMTTNPKAGQPDTGVRSLPMLPPLHALAIEFAEYLRQTARNLPDLECQPEHTDVWQASEVLERCSDALQALQSQLDTVTREREEATSKAECLNDLMKVDLAAREKAERERDAMREALDHADRYATSLGATRDHPLRVTIRKALQPEASK